MPRGEGTSVVKLQFKSSRDMAEFIVKAWPEGRHHLIDHRIAAGKTPITTMWTAYGPGRNEHNERSDAALRFCKVIGLSTAIVRDGDIERVLARPRNGRFYPEDAATEVIGWYPVLPQEVRASVTENAPGVYTFRVMVDATVTVEAVA